MDPLINSFDSLNSTKFIPLTFWTCFILNSDNATYPTLKENVYLKCRLKIKYALESECVIGNSYVQCGYWICVGVTALIVLLANFGIISNILNLIILPRSLSGSSVKMLMVLLAIFDLLATICAIPVALLMLLILGGYENRYGALEAFRVLFLLFSLGRTGSIFTTIMITIERYIAIAYPLKQFLTSKKARLHLIIVLVIIFLINLPWWLNKKTEVNELYSQIDNEGGNKTRAGWNDLTELPYVYKGTSFSKKVYSKISTFHIFLDFALPFPMLLIFNGLLYRSIYLSNKVRQTLTISQRREVNAGKMFSLVALILLLCHTVSLAIFICTQTMRVQFRELQFFNILAATLNAAINFLVYFLLGKAFRDEFWAIVRTCKDGMRRKRSSVTPSTEGTRNGTIELRISSSVKSQARSIKQQPQPMARV